MLEKNLEKAGLKPKEIKIYLAGIKAGPVLASYLSKKTGINRPNIYDNLKTLQEKGLVHTAGSKYNQRFVMEGPENLERFLERQKKQIDKKKEYLKMAIPEINAISSENASFPNIKFINDIEGIRNVMLDSLKCQNKEILGVIASKKFYDILGIDFVRDYVSKRIVEKIETKTIRLRSQESEENSIFSEHNEQLRKLRYIDESKAGFSQSFIIYENNTFYISSKKENFGLLIESSEHSEMMKNIFNILWEQSK